MVRDVTKVIEQYIGLPFEENGYGPDAFHCYGLIVQVYHDVFGIQLPQHYRASAKDTNRVSLQMVEALSSGLWTPIKQPAAWDVVVFRMAGVVSHCGMVVARDTMLHTIENRMSCLERLSDGRWKSRIHGYYRYNTAWQGVEHGRQQARQQSAHNSAVVSVHR